jgi:UDP-N-acetyl-D-glucosamine dehydrogenase
MGVSYKSGIGDVRESPALKIMDRLAEYGAQLSYHDPYVARVAEHDLVAEQDLDAALATADMAVIVTAHPGIDWERVSRSVPLVIDPRGVTRGTKVDNVIRL